GGPAGSRTHATMEVQQLLFGCAGKAKTFVLAGKGGEVTYTPTLAPLSARLVSFGNLPAIAVRYEARRLPRGIGYIELSAFFDPVTVMAALERDIKSFADTRGIVLDLRGNPGGVAAMGNGLG